MEVTLSVQEQSTKSQRSVSWRTVAILAALGFVLIRDNISTVELIPVAIDTQNYNTSVLVAEEKDEFDSNIGNKFENNDQQNGTDVELIPVAVDTQHMNTSVFVAGEKEELDSIIDQHNGTDKVKEYENKNTSVLVAGEKEELDSIIDQHNGTNKVKEYENKNTSVLITEEKEEFDSIIVNRVENNDKHDGTDKVEVYKNKAGSGNGSGTITHVLEQKRKMVFMHVGKAGGDTINGSVTKAGCYHYANMNKRMECLKAFRKRGESKISEATFLTCHCKPTCTDQKVVKRTTDLLFSVREPLGRFESAFKFHSPFNCEGGDIRRCNARAEAKANVEGYKYQFWFQCFRRLGDLAAALGDPGYHPNPGRRPSNSTKPAGEVPCHKFLRDLFSHRDIFEDNAMKGGHMSMGYRYYLYNGDLNRERIAQKKLWAVRVANLWDDIESIDTILGGDPNNRTYFDEVRGTHVSHRSEGFKEDIIPEDKAIYVCCALRPDMVAYRIIVDRAENLSPAERLATFQRTWNRCSGGANKNITSWESLDGVCDTLAQSNPTLSYIGENVEAYP